MIEVIERDTDTRVYFNFDAEEPCVCEGEGCGDICYIFPSRANADGFASALLRGGMKEIRDHWWRWCGCWDANTLGYALDDPECIHTRLSAQFQRWESHG